MAIRLMSLRGVPEDELEGICELFDKHVISYHVTPPGNWFISAGAIWLDDHKQLTQAHALLNAYQQERRQHALDEYTESRNRGEQTTLLDRIIEHPVRFVAYIIVIGFILYISVVPFVDLGN